MNWLLLLTTNAVNLVKMRPALCERTDIPRWNSRGCYHGYAQEVKDKLSEEDFKRAEYVVGETSGSLR